jgi:hypothetical protein
VGSAFGQRVSPPICAARSIGAGSVASGWPVISGRANRTLPFTCCQWIAETPTVDVRTARGAVQLANTNLHELEIE